MERDYERRVREQRREREAYFAEHPHSPVPSDQSGDFPGLAYFPVDPDYRFELDVHEHDDAETFTVETSTGGRQEYHRWGEFVFEFDGRRLTLQAYRSDLDDDRLWVPFRDDTNGEETYAAGRYLDLEAATHRRGDGRWVLDFNRAYNPTCAYNEAYECPLVPPENWLDVPITAGEKDFPGEPVGHRSHDRV